MLGAWEDDESPETLWSWLQLLEDEERAGVRTGKTFPRPLTAAGHFAALRLRLASAWDHYYAGRTGAASTALETLKVEAPGYVPTVQLSAAIDHELGLDHTALGGVRAAQRRWGPRPGLTSSVLTALRSAGMVTALVEGLDALTKGAGGDPSYIFQLAVLHAARGQTDAAVTLLDRVTEHRPERQVGRQHRTLPSQDVGVRV